MTGFQQFMLFSSVIYGALLVGWAAREMGLINEKISGKIMRRTIVFLEPFLIVLIYWALDLTKLRVLIVMPLAASLVSIGALVAGRLVAQAVGHEDRRERGSFVCCCMFSNVGLTMGSFICLLLLGQRALSLASLYAVYFLPFFFTIGMVVARRYSPSSKYTAWEMLARFLRDPISLAPNIAIVAGIAVNLITHGQRPQVLGHVTDALVLVDVSIYSVAIGLSMRFGRILSYWRDCLGMSLVKFIITPIIGIGVGLLLGCPGIGGGLAMQVVVIQSAMPVAIFALVLCKLFDLDMDLANASWIFTTFATAGVFLALKVIVPMLA
jgi:hypothetical protein